MPRPPAADTSSPTSIQFSTSAGIANLKNSSSFQPQHPNDCAAAGDAETPSEIKNRTARGIKEFMGLLLSDPAQQVVGRRDPPLDP